MDPSTDPTVDPTAGSAVDPTDAPSMLPSQSPTACIDCQPCYNSSRLVWKISTLHSNSQHSADPKKTFLTLTVILIVIMVWESDVVDV